MRLAVLLLAGVLAALAPAAAAPPQTAHLQRMIEAERLIAADKPGEALAVLRPLTAALEDEGDLDLLLTAYDLTADAATAPGEGPLLIAARTQVVLLGHIQAGAEAPDTVLAGRSLAEAWRRQDRGVAQFYALANVLAAVESARRAGPLSADMAHAAIIAPALMGQWLWADDRPVLAHAFFTRARAVADADPANAAKLDQVIAATREAIATETALPGPDDCIGDKGLDQARMAACRAAADRAFAQGDAAGAERILSNLLRDVPQGSLRADRYAAARDLMLLRLLSRDAADAELVASVNLVANYLPLMNEVSAAAILAARVARTLADRGLYDPVTVEVLGHIARRAARDGSPDLARRLLVLQRAANLAGIAPAASLAGLPEPLLDRHLTEVLLRIEAGHLAAASGHARLAEAEWTAAEHTVAALDLDAYARIEDMTTVRHAESLALVFPSYAGAVELVGRLARRLPADDPRRDGAQIQWAVALEAFRGDIARAGAIADATIADIRARPQGRSDALVTLLTTRARMLETANPPEAQRLTREAYEIVSRQPGQESLRIDLLLDLAGDQSDERLSRALVAEAQKLRQATPGIALNITARLDMQRALDFHADGDTTQAVDLAEAALARLVAERRKDHWSITTPAGKLAGIYAAAGRITDARRIYETYILPQSSAALIGEEGAIFYQLRLANLEAYYAPDSKTADTLAHLLDLARRRAAPGSDLIRSIRRSQAFAFHGLEMGRQARAAAQEALVTDRPPATDTTSAEEDRPLLEALVGAAWQVSRQVSRQPGQTQASP